MNWRSVYLEIRHFHGQVEDLLGAQNVDAECVCEALIEFNRRNYIKDNLRERRRRWRGA